VHPENGEATR
jgi:hypothetical protein